MYKIEGNKITLTKGDSFYCEVGMNTETGEAYTPQEGDVIRFGLKLTANDEEPLIEKIIPNDTQILHLDPDDTKDLKVQTYRYDCEITYENGDVDTFINDEEFVLAPEVI